MQYCYGLLVVDKKEPRDSQYGKGVQHLVGGACAQAGSAEGEALTAAMSCTLQPMLIRFSSRRACLLHKTTE